MYYTQFGKDNSVILVENVEGPCHKTFQQGLFDFMADERGEHYKDISEIPVVDNKFKYPLFRIYNSYSKKWYYGNGIAPSEKPGVYNFWGADGSFTDMELGDLKKLEMFTGDTDMDGKPVYDYSIVKTDEGGWVGMSSSVFNRFIGFSSDSGFSTDPNFIASKIIGDKFENPDLVKKYISNGDILF